MLIGSGCIVIVMTASAVAIITGKVSRPLDAAAALINQSVGAFYRCALSEQFQFSAMKACNITASDRPLTQSADVILLGNSHAQMYTPLVKEILIENGLEGLLVPLNACLPTPKYNKTVRCIEMAQQNLDAIVELPGNKTIVIATDYWHDYLVDSDGIEHNNAGNIILLKALDDLIASLVAGNKRVVLIGPLAQPGYNIASELSRSLAFKHQFTKAIGIDVDAYHQRFLALNTHYQNSSTIIYIQPDTIQCDKQKCHYIIDGRSLFADGSHLSIHELWRFKAVFEAAFD